MPQVVQGLHSLTIVAQITHGSNIPLVFSDITLYSPLVYKQIGVCNANSPNQVGSKIREASHASFNYK